MSDTPPHRPVISTNWLLQEDGSCKPVRVEWSGHLLVSSMIPSLNGKSGGATQTWGVVATLIKQHDQLLDSQPVDSQPEFDTTVGSSMVDPDYIDTDNMSIDDTKIWSTMPSARGYLLETNQR